MSEPQDRVKEALAAHLEHLELGGPAPDVSHLSSDERGRLEELMALLDQTEGVAFGRGLGERSPEVAAATGTGERVVAVLRDALPPSARTRSDPAARTTGLPGLRFAEGWIVGTFGGRVRVWLLEGDGTIPSSDEGLRILGRVFRMFPDTAAVALVQEDLSCLIVSPEDTAPAIEVPGGSIVARRYRRPVQPVAEALEVFFRELMPSWEPMRAIGGQTAAAIDVAPIARERASRAIEDQIAAGGRARRTNPKRSALTGLGEVEAAALAAMLIEIQEGRAEPGAIDAELRRLAANP